MKVIEKIVMIPIRLANDRNIHHPNRVVIAVNGIAVVHRQIENTKNPRDDAVRAVAVIVVATHVIRTDHESTQGGNAHRPMIAQANRARAATNVINIQEKRATPEVTATNEAVTE